ncbi:MAG: nucleotidyltransferase family protein [Clostridiales bacterium]|nr:nucleotidyltransferase family protein [Clostridiales bacterium]
MEGIILAAGYSTRFPDYKMVQEINNRTLIEHTIHQMKEYVTQIFVVTGYHHELIETILKDYKNVSCLYNDEFDNGMFSSVKKGVSMVNDSFFLIPGDCPFVKKSTYEALLDADGEVVIPSYKMKSGHPIKISKTLIESLKKSRAVHLREFINTYDKQYVTVDDSWILEDIDDKDTFERIKGRLENENY